MKNPVVNCSVCGRLLRYKWFSFDIYEDEDATIPGPGKKKLPRYKVGSYGICRVCFLNAMGVIPDGKPSDVEKMREVPVGPDKPVRTRRTAVTKADIDRYRRSTGNNRSKEKSSADRKDWEFV